MSCGRAVTSHKLDVAAPLTDFDEADSLKPALDFSEGLGLKPPQPQPRSFGPRAGGLPAVIRSRARSLP